MLPSKRCQLANVPERRKKNLWHQRSDRALGINNHCAWTTRPLCSAIPGSIKRPAKFYELSEPLIRVNRVLWWGFEYRIPFNRKQLFDFFHDGLDATATGRNRDKS